MMTVLLASSWIRAVYYDLKAAAIVQASIKQKRLASQRLRWQQRRILPMKIRLAAATACLVLSSALAAPAYAKTVVGFDDLQTGEAVPAGYEGLNWDQFSVKDGAAAKGGFPKGIVSGKNVAYNNWAQLATISSTSSFAFNSGYFTSAWNNGMTVNVTGFVGGVQTFADSFVVDSTGPTFRNFDWLNLSSVSFEGRGGINQGYGGGGTHIIFDDLTFNAAVTGAVPEPATWAMMILGFGIIGAAMRRRRQHIRAAFA